MIQFNKETCGNLDAALRREWLETNGLGGFASSSIIGLNTRRYHGLLVDATKPPVGCNVMLSKLEETLFIDGQPFDLSANRYPGALIPRVFDTSGSFASIHSRSFPKKSKASLLQAPGNKLHHHKRTPKLKFAETVAVVTPSMVPSSQLWQARDWAYL